MTERRKAPRFSTEVPVILEHGTGMTQNLSPLGVYFRTDEALDLNAPLYFRLIFWESPPAHMTIFRCRGAIIRQDLFWSDYGVATNIEDCDLEEVFNGKPH